MFALIFNVKAQQYFFKNYSPESGLIFVQSAAMYQDSKGYLWAGGFGGLTRFDGKLFLNYGPKNGLIDHNVTAICEGEEGRIFVGTTKGLSVINNKRISNYNLANGFSDINITALSKGYHHEMYIGTATGLYTFLNNTVNEISPLKGYKINAIFVSDSSEIYLGTNKGLIIYGGNKFTVLNEKNGLPSNFVNCIIRSGNKIVLGTQKGLSFYETSTGKFTNYYIENGLIDENITSLLDRKKDGLWIGSQSGLLKFEEEKFSYYNIGIDNNSNLVKCLLEDREDNLWIGTHSGIYKYRDNAFSTFDKVNGPGNAFIFQIFRDKSGDLWMCSENNGIYRYSQGYFKRYGLKEGLNTNVCKSGMQDKSGRLLFGTKNSLLQFRNDKFYEITLPKEFSGSHEMIFQCKDGTTWIAGGNGISSLKWIDNKPELKYYALPAQKNYQVYSLEQDNQGNLLIGTGEGGLYKMINDSIYNYGKKLGLDEENYFALRYYNGYIFSASLNGLYIIDTERKKSRYISEQDGLNSELVYSIEFAENKNALWIGTNQGINRLDLRKYFTDNRVVITSYSKPQGFMGVECNSNGIWEDTDGSLWFGTVSGLVKHEPYNIKKNQAKNLTVIQNIKLFSEDTLLKDGAELPSKFNTITFYYKGICLTNPEKVLYVKKLEGLESDWSLPSNEDYSKYANLAPGKYTFKVKSCNNEGVWDENETTFSFTILRPYYSTWWFILLVIVSVLLVSYLIVVIRIKNIQKKQRLEFERKVEMSKIELKALRSQMNPHFIFNSLNSIQHYIYHNKSDEAIKYLSKFARLVRIILNNSNKPTVTIGEDLEALRLYLELEQMRFEEKFDYEIIIDPSVDMDYDIMPPLLTQPYVENAILHGLNPKPDKGKLTISFTSNNNFLICTITDNGIGREKASEIKRTMPVSKHKSLGMKITEDRLRILNEVNNSQLSVNITDLKDEKGYGTGTKVELFIPI